MTFSTYFHFKKVHGPPLVFEDIGKKRTLWAWLYLDDILEKRTEGGRFHCLETGMIYDGTGLIILEFSAFVKTYRNVYLKW